MQHAVKLIVQCASACLLTLHELQCYGYKGAAHTSHCKWLLAAYKPVPVVDMIDYSCS